MADANFAIADPLLKDDPPHGVRRGRKVILVLSLFIGIAALQSPLSQHLDLQWPAITLAGVVLQPERAQLLQPVRSHQPATAARLSRFASLQSAQPARLPSRTGPIAYARPKISDFVDRTNDALVLNPGEFGDPEFEDDVRRRFPEAGVCSAKEARVLLEDGYTWLDVRTDQEWNTGHIPLGIAEHVPIINGNRQFDSETGTRVFKNQKANAAFIARVKEIFPDPNSPILVACSDSRARAMMALEALDEAGYTHIVGIRGGYLGWQQLYDAKFRRRRQGEVAEVFGHEGDTAGIHGSGAGAGGAWESTGGMSVEAQPTRDDEQWIDYFEDLESAR